MCLELDYLHSFYVNWKHDFQKHDAMRFSLWLTRKELGRYCVISLTIKTCRRWSREFLRTDSVISFSLSMYVCACVHMVFLSYLQILWFPGLWLSIPLKSLYLLSLSSPRLQPSPFTSPPPLPKSVFTTTPNCLLSSRVSCPVCAAYATAILTSTGALRIRFWRYFLF